MLCYVVVIYVLLVLCNDLYKDLMCIYFSKICCFILKKFDVDEYIKNIFLYCLLFFEKFVICRGLKFFLLQKVLLIDV